MLRSPVVLAVAACFASALAQEPPPQQAWVQRTSGGPLHVPRCQASDREMVERVSVGIATEFQGRFELTVQADGSISAVKTVEVLPKKSNPARRWAMLEAKCLRKATFDVQSFPDLTFPYAMEVRRSSSTSDRSIDLMDLNRMQRSVEEKKE